MMVAVSWPFPSSLVYFSRAPGATVSFRRPVLFSICQPDETLPPPKPPSRAVQSVLAPPCCWTGGCPADWPPRRVVSPPPPPSRATSKMAISFHPPSPPARVPALRCSCPRPLPVLPTGPVPRPSPRFCTVFAGPDTCFSRPLGLLFSICVISLRFHLCLQRALQPSASQGVSMECRQEPRISKVFLIIFCFMAEQGGGPQPAALYAAPYGKNAACYCRSRKRWTDSFSFSA